jgi:hypothetical protein
MYSEPLGAAAGVKIEVKEKRGEQKKTKKKHISDKDILPPTNWYLS